MKLENAHKIKHILKLVDGKGEIIVRVRCPICRTKKALLLIGSTDKYECQVCLKQGGLDDVIVYFEDEFERRHRQTIQTMTERSVVDL
jgi:hypothetical protein